jgi:hypothetical protein
MNEKSGQKDIVGNVLDK